MFYFQCFQNTKPPSPTAQKSHSKYRCIVLHYAALPWYVFAPWHSVCVQSIDMLHGPYNWLTLLFPQMNLNENKWPVQGVFVQWLVPWCLLIYYGESENTIHYLTVPLCVTLNMMSDLKPIQSLDHIWSQTATCTKTWGKKDLQSQNPNKDNSKYQCFEKGLKWLL